MALSNSNEFEMRILAELEEAGEEDVSTLLNTVATCAERTSALTEFSIAFGMLYLTYHDSADTLSELEVRHD